MIRSDKPSVIFSPGAVPALLPVSIDRNGGESQKKYFNVLVPCSVLRQLTIEMTVDQALAAAGNPSESEPAS